MDEKLFSGVLPQQLNSLLAVRGDISRWSTKDLADILHHQLAAPLLADLRPTESFPSDTLDDLVNQLGRRGASFGDLLSHPKPPIGLLRAVKDFAKSSDRDPEQPLPPQIATLIYYACIAAALSRHGIAISNLSASDLRTGVTWALNEPWAATPGLTALFHDTARQLDSPQANSELL